MNETAGTDPRLSPNLGGAPNAAPVVIRISGPEVVEPRDIADTVRALLAGPTGITDVRDNLGPFRTEARFRPRDEALSFYGIGEQELQDQVRIAMTADKVGTYSMPGAGPDLGIRLGMQFPSRQDIGGPRELFDLETMNVIGPEGDRLPVVYLLETDLRPLPTNSSMPTGVVPSWSVPERRPM